MAPLTARPRLATTLRAVVVAAVVTVGLAWNLSLAGANSGTTSFAFTAEPVDPGPIGLDRAVSALHQSVPARWLDQINPPMSIRPGSMSLAYWDSSGLPLETEIGSAHVAAGWAKLRFVVTHEWAHHLSFTHGTGAYPGAPPEGWPATGRNDAELFADCVALVLTDFAWVPPGRRACSSAQLDWVESWLTDHSPAAVQLA